jgi:hypothetical protein
MKKIISFSLVILGLSLIVYYFYRNQVSAQISCPSQTTFTTNSAVLVGEITDNGGDPNLEVWFKWGQGSSLSNETTHQFINASSLPYRFCSSISGLQPCTTYSYQAVVRNSAGTAYGSTYSFMTRCQPASVDLKVNGSDGPLNVNYGTSLNLTWTSSNANSCSASGAWSGSKSLTGSETISNLNVGNYTFTLTCTGSSGSVSDSVNVRINANLPSVRTLPAVETL